MKRSPMPAGDPEKAQAWRERSVANARRNRESKVRTVPLAKPRRIRRNDAPWRNEVMATYGATCRSCGDTAHPQADHMMPRSQGGPSVVENGLVLCGEFSRVTPGGCHPAKTASRIVIRPEWLTPPQIAWLAQVGWVAWDDDGQPYGRGCRHFAARAAA